MAADDFEYHFDLRGKPVDMSCADYIVYMLGHPEEWYDGDINELDYNGIYIYDHGDKGVLTIGDDRFPYYDDSSTSDVDESLALRNWCESLGGILKDHGRWATLHLRQCYAGFDNGAWAHPMLEKVCQWLNETNGNTSIAVTGCADTVDYSVLTLGGSLPY